MGCLTVLLSMLVPRVVMVFIWILNDWFDRAYETWYWPLLGFFFMPYTTLAYMAAMLRNNNVSGGWLVLVVVAAIVDIGHWGGSDSVRRRRSRRP